MKQHFSTPKKPLQLQVVSVQSTDIPPKENLTYAKQTQTTTSGVTELRDGKPFYNNLPQVFLFQSFFAHVPKC